MLRPEIKPADGTPGVGTPSKPKPEEKPAPLLPWLVPQPRPAPEPEPAPGPPALDVGPSPYYTQEVTSYAQPPTSEAEAQRREQRKERAKKRWEKARKQAPATATPAEIVTAPDLADLGVFDSAQANDESLFQIGLPDIEEAQDECGINLDRLHAFSNLEFLLVWQDMEMRPLTFKRCFELAESPRSAMEYLYAEPPDLDERELAYLDQVSQDHTGLRMGRGGDGEDGNDAEDIGSARYHSVYRDEEYLRFEYGFEIKWDEHASSRQLNNLGKAADLIVNYLSREVYDGDRDKARSAFRRYFSQNEHGRLVVHLGADRITGGPRLGPVPLPASGTENLDAMFLGSLVDIPTIVHEFGHVIDRSSRIVARFPMHHNDWYSKTQTGLNDTILLAIEGFAGKQLLHEEVWADVFMTAVLDPSVSGETFQVYSTTYLLLKDHVDQVEAELIRQGVNKEVARATAQRTFYECDKNAGCEDRDVKWADKSPMYRFDFGALVQEHFPTLLSDLLME